jgi:hypothetical protein
MKTHVIQIGPHDDVISVRDQMTWAKTPRILLVVPPGIPILNRKLDLQLLKRHASRLGAKLALVAEQKGLIQSAQGLGISVFPTVSSAQTSEWENKPEPIAESPDSHPLKVFETRVKPNQTGNVWKGGRSLRLWVFSLSVLAILALPVVFVPSVQIHLSPETTLQNASIPVNASDTLDKVYITGSIPARVVFTQLDGNQMVEVTGTVNIPDQSATGVVQFRNLTTGVVGVPAGTIIGTRDIPSIRFSTTQDAIIPAGVGKTADVPVSAMEPGSDGNLPANSLVSMEGDLGASLAVTNTNPTIGGTNQTAPIQTAEDRSRVQTLLVQDLLDRCGELLSSMISSDDLAFPDTMSISRILSEAYFPPPDQAGGTLSLSLSLQCQETYVALTDLEDLSRMVLDASLPVGYEPVSTAITIPRPEEFQVLEGGTLHWDMVVQRVIRASINPFNAALAIIGSNRAEAAGKLVGKFLLNTAPVIRLKPSWWPWLPLLPMQIHFSVENP